jgi:hypothetical protein
LEQKQSIDSNCSPFTFFLDLFVVTARPFTVFTFVFTFSFPSTSMAESCVPCRLRILALVVDAVTVMLPDAFRVALALVLILSSCCGIEDRSIVIMLVERRTARQLTAVCIKVTSVTQWLM